MDAATTSLNEVVQKAITEFTTDIPAETTFAAFLTKLGTAISVEYASAKSNIDAKVAELETARESVKTKSKVKVGTPVVLKPLVPTPKLESMTKSLVDVNTFINANKDAIFLATGGSFNPPHNGHIKMFETAYNQLMTIPANADKKVYGVMVPAPNAHIEDKLCKEALKTETCSDPNSQTVKDAINLKRIDLPNRVNLCTLSCNSFKWSAPGKFGPSNMIVVNEANNDPGANIVSKSPANTYYLCGSDYYAKAKDSKYRFIFITRNGDSISSRNTTSFTLKESSTTVINVKAGDIMIPGDETEDSEASSSRLRDILEKLKDADISTDDAIIDKLNVPTNTDTKLLTKEVYCELLKTGYIVGETKGIQYAELLGCNDSAHHDEDHENTDKPASYLSTGLKNGGNYCYLNSAFQLLFSAETLRNWVESQSPITEDATIESNAVKLLKLMVDSSKAGSKKTVDGNEFKKKLEELIANMSKGGGFNVGGQNDSHEVVGPVLDTLLTKLPGSVDNLKFREFVRQTKETVITIPVSDNSEKCITGVVPIADDKITSIQSALDSYILPTRGSSKGITVESQIQLQFGDSNRYFIVVLNRTAFDTSTKKSTMNNKIITVDKKITVSQSYNAAGAAISPAKEYYFKLRGATLKSGGASGGHYKYISYENGPTNNPITYDDPSVYDSKPEELTGDASIVNNSSLFLYERVASKGEYDKIK
jgi:ubiquitin C-terminal hydrolase